MQGAQFVPGIGHVLSWSLIGILGEIWDRLHPREFVQ